MLAVTDGSRVAGFVTHVPRRSREVFCAMSASSTYGSFQSTWLSKTQPYAKPDRSASFASRTTRSSGWSGFSVNPKSMEPPSLGQACHCEACSTRMRITGASRSGMRSYCGYFAARSPRA